MCILEVYGDYFTTSDLQYGLKKPLGCSHALYTVKAIVQHFTSGNSMVNLCALDVSKAFDKLNHYALVIKLMDRNVPLVFLNVLVYWYAMCSQLCDGTVCFLVWCSYSVGLGRMECCHLFYLHCMLMI